MTNNRKVAFTLSSQRWRWHKQGKIFLADMLRMGKYNYPFLAMFTNANAITNAQCKRTPKKDGNISPENRMIFILRETK